MIPVLLWDCTEVSVTSTIFNQLPGHRAGPFRQKGIMSKAAFILITVTLASLYLLWIDRMILGNAKEGTQGACLSVSVIIPKQGLHKVHLSKQFQRHIFLLYLTSKSKCHLLNQFHRKMKTILHLSGTISSVISVL